MASKRHTFFLRMLDPSLIVAGICTVAFYAMVLQPSMQHSLLHRYTTEHVVDYVIVTLWIWGIVDLILRLGGFPRELLALTQTWIPERRGVEPVARAHTLYEDVMEHPRWALKSRIGQRLSSALKYVVQKGSAEDFRDHLQYLATLDEDKTYTNYTLPRFVIAVTPVLGFLGTVVHFGTALSGISFDQMAEKLPVVVSEMGQAFNTTTTALAAAMSMMFALFMCERIEKGYLHQIDRLVDRELLNRFEIKDSNLTPFLSSIKDANDEALAMIASTLEKHTDVWLSAFSGILEKFDERQQQEGQAWKNVLTVLNARHEAMESQRQTDYQKQIEDWKQTLHLLEQRHEKLDQERENRLNGLVVTLDQRQQTLIQQMEGAFEKAISFREGVTEMVQSLHHIQKDESRLVEVQTTLAKNLRLIHETQKIDDALHGLTAAIHLLTARHRGDTDRIAA